MGELLKLKFNILIADDDCSVYTASIKPFVNDIPEAKIYSVSTPLDCRKIMNEIKFGFILLDISFGQNDFSGLQLLDELKKVQPDAKIFMLSSHDDQNTMLRCMQSGATDFISKRDIDIANIASIIRGFIQSQEQDSLDLLEGQKLAEKFGVSFGSDLMQNVFKLVMLARRNSSVNVLITGETGVGKDLIANAISQPEKRRQFVAVDCGAITESVAESILFGHVKGAFTGADRFVEGKFYAANNGDLFLDEIGNLKRSIQEKLLRAVQNQEITPVGGKQQKIKVRVIAATNAHLDDMVNLGTFRQDLLERLRSIVIHIPPLRQRIEDIPFIIKSIITSSSKPDLEMAPACMSLLMSYSWPGNVRELENIVRATINSAVTKLVTIRNLPPHFLESLSSEMKVDKASDEIIGPTVKVDIPLEVNLQHAEDVFLKAFISAKQNNLGTNTSNVELASRLNISRNTLRSYVKRLGLSFGSGEK